MTTQPIIDLTREIAGCAECSEPLQAVLDTSREPPRVMALYCPKCRRTTPMVDGVVNG